MENTTKVCTKCKLERKFSEFGKKGNNCQLRTMCKFCVYIANKLYKEKNKEQLKIKKKIYLDGFSDEKKKKFSEKKKSSYKKWRKNLTKEEKEKLKKYQKEYKISHKKERRLRDKNRTKLDPVFKSKEKIRLSIIKSIKRNGYSKNSSTKEIVGCSFEELKNHLESKFKTWMSWKNHGLYNGKFNYGWDIDHKIPLNSAKTEEELLKLCHYTNLQPLCSKVNRDIKRDKIY